MVLTVVTSIGSEAASPLDGNARDGGRTPLDDLADLVADDLRTVNALIVERMQSSVELIPQLAGYIVAAGGKRLRPLLTLASARMCGYQGGDHHCRLAAAVEFIHTATLLHDDVVDDSELRRGRASANAVFGNQASVLVGDFLFSRAFLLMVDTGSIEVLEILSKASAVISEGEVLQLQTTNDTGTDEEAYLAVIRAKTAALFAAACRLGAVISGLDRESAEALESYGMNLGIAFQLVDDVLDYSALQSRLGKTVGDDFREGKITLPVVLAFARGDESERVFWRRVLEDSEQTSADLEHAMALMRSHGALDESIRRAEGYANAARAALARFPDCRERQILGAVVDFVVDREY